jgi:ferrochelatase
MTTANKSGLLLVNLGTPESPRPADVRPFLREFLMDPRVIDIPAWRRWLIVNLLILPFRPRQSGEAYAKIWTDRGSPLLFHTRDLAEGVRRKLGSSVRVEVAMRYGKPSIAAALRRLRDDGIDRIVVFPLYPQYSSAATGSTVEKVFAEASKLWNVPYLQVVPPFYDHPAFVDACSHVARPYLERLDPEKVFFSFHGLPERQVRKSDDSGSHCLSRDDCCARITQVNRNCYRAQCLATARLIAERLGVAEDKRVVCFQSRLGRTPWLKPYTDLVLAEQARRGCRRVAILSPAFVADCLETTEELGIRGVETWKENGGEALELVPAVNATEPWIDAVVTIARETTPWLDASATDLEDRPGEPLAAQR